jgi:hypothetical protein
LNKKKALGVKAFSAKKININQNKTKVKFGLLYSKVKRYSEGF